MRVDFYVDLWHGILQIKRLLLFRGSDCLFVLELIMLEFLAGLLVGAAVVLLWQVYVAHAERKAVEADKQAYIYPGHSVHIHTPTQIRARWTSLDDKDKRGGRFNVPDVSQFYE